MNWATFTAAEALWRTAHGVVIMPSGFTRRTATAIDGSVRSFICGRLPKELAR
jgi:hypothetical protein